MYNGPHAARMFLAVLLLLAQDSKAWIEIDGRHGDHAPKLVIDGKDVAVTENSLLISYLGDRAFPAMKTLAVSLADTNRALMKFDLEGVDKPAKAELVLHLRLPQMAPREPFELGLYVVTEAWDGKVTWNSQPAYDKTPAVKTLITPKEGEIRIDVTDLVRKGLKNGMLLRVTRPLGGDADAARSVERDLRAMMKWTTLEKAKEAGRPILAVVVSEDDPNRMPVSESVLLACVFAHPEVRALVDKHFSAVRIAVNPMAYPTGKIPGLGTPLKDAKPPSLVVADTEGRVLRTLSSLGTFDAVSYHDFLRKGLDVPAMKLSKAAALLREGKSEEARAALKGLGDAESLYVAGDWDGVVQKHPSSGWALKARARLAWPERMSMFESVAAPDPFGATTEVPTKDEARAVRRAVDWLVAHQQKDGAWAAADQGDVYHAPVTALAARALFAHADALDGERKKRVNDALSRATDWMRAYVAKADPATANSWGTAYLLDYFVDRHAANKAFAPSVEKAIALHVGGQLPNGAWSYDRGFGTSWRGGIGSWPKTDKGRAHSMNTGPALVALARAKKAGFAVADEVLKKGTEALLAMRKQAGVFTYTWPDPESFAQLDQSIGRAPGCEHALLLLGAATEKDADVAVDTFMKHRADLRVTVKLTAGWSGPRANSSYFYHVAYFDAARLIAERGAKDHLAKLREDLLGVVEADGTWVDFQDVGKAYSTAMALIVLKAGR